MSTARRVEETTLAWARLYTRGVDRPLAERRLAELASDCHEQRQWGVDVGASSLLVATSMVARTLAGVPADLHWRHMNRATVRDPSPHTTGRPMDKLRRNWWLVLAALAGSLQVAMAIVVPFEDRTLGAILGGLVTGAAGIAMLAGIRVRREHRVAGDLLIAGGTLPLMAWLWTLVLPLLALAVALPAVLDAADAGSRGLERADEPPTGTRATGGRPTTVLTGMVVATATLAAVLGSPYLVLALVAPTFGLLVGVLATGRVRQPLVRAGLVVAAAGVVQEIVTWLLTSDVLADFNDPVDAGSSSVAAAIIVGQVAIVVGIVLVLVGLTRRTHVPEEPVH